MNKTGIVRDHIFLEHKMDLSNPETPGRLSAIYKMLDDSGLTNELLKIDPRLAELDELEQIHSKKHIETIFSTRGKEQVVLDYDTMTSAVSCDAALTAAGGLCELVNKVMIGELDNAFALVRPPGHHAEKNKAMGFCLFNNIAIAARYAQRKLNCSRVLIVDWDVHHGNGSQHSFERDDSVLFFSSHQHPLYPGTGAVDESGIGDGEGYTVNVPCPSGYGNAELIEIYRELLVPIAEQFDPDIVLVSAGFDMHRDDPLGGMQVTDEGFAALAGILMDVAEKSCGGKIVFSLEGGYDLDGLTCSVRSVLEVLLCKSLKQYMDITDSSGKNLSRLISQIRELHSQSWSF